MSLLSELCKQKVNFFTTFGELFYYLLINSDLYSMVTDELRAYFSEKGIKQVEVADKLGVKKSFISELLAGKRTLGHETAVKLNKVYGFDLNWLLTGEGEMLKGQAEAPEVGGKPAGSLDQVLEQYQQVLSEMLELRKNNADLTKEVGQIRELQKRLEEERGSLLEQNKKLTDIIERLTKEG